MGGFNLNNLRNSQLSRFLGLNNYRRGEPIVPAPAPQPVAAPAPPPPMVAPPPAVDSEGIPTNIQPVIGQGVGSFLLNERFGQNIPVEPRVPITVPPPAVAPAPPPPAAVAPPPMMGGFNINLPGLNFNLTPEAIDAARRLQGLPPLNAAPEPVAPPVAAPAPPPPAVAPQPVPPPAAVAPPPMMAAPHSQVLSAPSERFEPIQADLPVQPAPQPPPVMAPPPPPVVAPPPPIIDSEGIPAVITPPPVIAPPPPPPVVEPAPAPVVAPPPPPPVITPPPPPPPQPRDSLGDLVLSAPSERFEPIQADLPVQPAPQPPPVVTPPPPPVVEPAPAPTPAVAMRDRLADSRLNQFLGLDERRPMSSETRWGQPVPAQRPRVTPTPPEPTPPAVDEGIASLTRDALSATQYPGLEGFDPANPLNPPVAAPAPVAPAPAAPEETYTPPPVEGDEYIGSPPIGYQGGGGEYNPQDGYTDEDRIAEDEWYASQRRQQREEAAAQPEPPPPPVLDPSPPVEDDYIEVPPPGGGDDYVEVPPPGGGDEVDPGTPPDSGQDGGPTLPPPFYDPEAPTGGGQDGGDVVVTVPDAGGDLYTPGPVVGREEEPPEDTGPAGPVITRDGDDTIVQLPDESAPDESAPELPEEPEIPQRQRDLALTVARMAVGLSDYPADMRFDLDGDGEITIVDAIQILKGDFPEEFYDYEIGAAQEPAPAPAPEPEPEPAPPIEIEPEQPLPRYRYTPYVPQQFNYILPDVARNFAPFAGMGSFQPRPFTGGVSDSDLDVGYGDVTAPELSLPPATYQPIPSFQVAQPEYVQIQGPSAPVVDPFATPIRPEFAPLPTYERTAYAPRTQKMVDQILSEEEMANPFMNPYLRSGVFGGR